MPYIDSYRRDLLDEHIEKLFNKLHNGKEIDYGAVEYIIFKLFIQLTGVNKRFNTLNSLVGVLETTKAEYLNKIVSPYEGDKLLEDWFKANGK